MTPAYATVHPHRSPRRTATAMTAAPVAIRPSVT
jgi:hypothetical protein